jgi:hypothetical protein
MKVKCSSCRVISDYTRIIKRIVNGVYKSFNVVNNHCPKCGSLKIETIKESEHER